MQFVLMCMFDYLFNIIYPTLDFKLCEDGTMSIFSLLYSPAATTGLSTWLGLVDGWMLDGCMHAWFILVDFKEEI